MTTKRVKSKAFSPKYEYDESGCFQYLTLEIQIQDGAIIDQAKISKWLLGEQISWPTGKGTIYILKKGKEYIYVGSSTRQKGKSPLVTIQGGLTRKYPYKFSQKNGRYSLHLFTFGRPKMKSRQELGDEAAAKMHFMETIEAELVYLIRFCTGAWPTYQHEIHFRPDLSKLPVSQKCLNYAAKRLDIDRRKENNGD